MTRHHRHREASTFPRGIGMRIYTRGMCGRLTCRPRRLRTRRRSFRNANSRRRTMGSEARLRAARRYHHRQVVATSFMPSARARLPQLERVG